MATPQNPPVTYSLAVNPEHFLDALRQIKKLTGLSGQSAVFTFEDQQLRIDLGGCSFRANAEGTWQGQAAVAVKLIQGLAKAPPTGKGPVMISCDGESLRIGHITLKCKWDRLHYPRITLPLGTTSLLEILSLRKRYSADDIRHSELEKVVIEAESQATKLMENAVIALRLLEFTKDDLQRILEEKVAGIVHKLESDCRSCTTNSSSGTR